MSSPTQSPPVDDAASLPAEETLSATADVAFEAVASDGVETDAKPRFSMVAYTGAAMWFPQFKDAPVVVDLDGMEISNQSKPVRFDHDSKSGVGHTDSIAIVGGQLLASGVISRDTPEAREVVESSKSKFPWQASIGIKAMDVEKVRSDRSVNVNGQTHHGPVYVARRSRLVEISFVDAGADDRTTAMIAASAEADSERENTTMSSEANVVTEGTELNAAATPVPPVGGGKSALTKILDAQRAENARQAKIVELTAEAIHDYPHLTEQLGELSETALACAETGVNEFELQILRATKRAHLSGGVADRRNKGLNNAILEAAICRTCNLRDWEKKFDAPTLEASDRLFPHGIGLKEVIHLAARQNGYDSFSANDVRPMLKAAFRDRDERQHGHHLQAAFSTVSLPGVLSNAMNKFVLDGFNAVESGWRSISSIRPVSDFKTMTGYGLTGDMKFEKLGASGEIAHGTIGETTYSNRADTYARMMAITRQDIINDDLGAFDRVRQKLGRGGALALNEVFWTAFMDNAAFFATGNSNYYADAAAVLSVASLTVVEQMFFDLTDPNGNPLGLTPKTLLVPNSLNSLASSLFHDRELRNNTANTIQLTGNPHAGKFDVVRSSYLSKASITGYSTLAWYLLANPADLPVIETCFLNGRDVPVIEEAEADFNQLGIQVRGYYDFGVAKMEPRAGIKSKGAA